MIDVFSCALSWILLIAAIQKDGSWNPSLVMCLQCQAVVKSLSHLVLFCFFFSCLEGYMSAQMPKCFQICFCNNLQPCVIPSFVKKCTDANCVCCCQRIWSPWGCEPWTLVAHLVWKLLLSGVVGSFLRGNVYLGTVNISQLLCSFCHTLAWSPPGHLGFGLTAGVLNRKKLLLLSGSCS